MLKNLSSLVHTIQEKTYQFICDQDSPLDNVEEALFQFLNYVRQVKEAVKAQAAKAQESKDSTETKEEVPKE
jgi:hypothetical protein